MEDEKLIEFTKEFFKSLGCEVFEDKEFLTVKNVPEKFEKYYGKSSPYKIVFDRKEEKEDLDIVTKGSYLLKAMTSYLDKSGETTLLKIDFQVNPEEEIKKRIKLSNCEIARLSQKRRYDYFSRFTFLTTFQYLNGKEQITNDIYVYKGKVIKGDLSSYKVIDGDKREVNIENIDSDYSISKEELKEQLKEKTQKISLELKEKLEKEIERIEKHFKQKNIEGEENLKKLLARKDSLEKQKKNEEVLDFEQKIKKLSSEIENVKRESNLESLEREKEQEVKLELYKHSLNISNKIINTTIIYYPLLSFEVFLKNNSSKRMVDVTHNPLTNEMSEVFCDSCKEKTEEFLLDGSGHLICKDCKDQCGDCKEIYCKKCLIKKCNFCGKNICMKCSTRCNGCGKDFCLSHTKKDIFDGKDYCFKCLVICEKCGKYYKKVTGDKKKLCEKCNMEEIKKSTLKSIFREY